jgi:uncharacterized protein
MPRPGPREAAQIVSTAGGEIIGTTRLQKIGCLLELAGAGAGFDFAYHLFGPYSEALSIAAMDAGALDLMKIEQRTAAWGGRYCIYKTLGAGPENVSPSVQRLAKAASVADSVDLELAVTAAFLAKNGRQDPWNEVAARKKDKATEERLGRARALYASFMELDLPQALPVVR